MTTTQKIKNTAFLLAKALGAKDYKVTKTAFTIYFDDLNTSEACFLHLRDNYSEKVAKVEWHEVDKAVKITF